MRYQPTDRPDRGHIGEHWNKYYLRSIQIILQATHGVVSGAPEFFKKAFGDTEDEFLKILRMPHDFIFNRDWYEKYGSRAELEEFNVEFKKLDESEVQELMDFLASHFPSEYLKESKKIKNNKIKNMIPFYKLLTEEENKKIWSSQKQIKNKLKIAMADDEIVEDAGLDHNPDSEIEENMRKVISQIINMNNISKQITVGKDILELLTSGMYLDPLTIYREYIQNSADSIEKAVSKGLLKSIEG